MTLEIGGGKSIPVNEHIVWCAFQIPKRGCDPPSMTDEEARIRRNELGSSPSQDKSIDFLRSAKLVVNQVRLPSYKNYSGKVFTYKLDRTTVMVGAPSMLVMSTSPASAGASSAACAATGSSVQ
jgi:hypothetical protein